MLPRSASILLFLNISLLTNSLLLLRCSLFYTLLCRYDEASQFRAADMRDALEGVVRARDSDSTFHQGSVDLAAKVLESCAELLED